MTTVTKQRKIKITDTGILKRLNRMGWELDPLGVRYDLTIEGKKIYSIDSSFMSDPDLKLEIVLYEIYYLLNAEKGFEYFSVEPVIDYIMKGKDFNPLYV